METQNLNTAHSLYTLYEALPNETQQAFLQELLEKQQQQLEDLAFYLACKQAKDENDFLSESEKHSFINSLTE